GGHVRGQGREDACERGVPAYRVCKWVRRSKAATEPARWSLRYVARAAFAILPRFLTAHAPGTPQGLTPMAAAGGAAARPRTWRGVSVGYSSAWSQDHFFHYTVLDRVAAAAKASHTSGSGPCGGRRRPPRMR